MLRGSINLTTIADFMVREAFISSHAVAHTTNRCVTSLAQILHEHLHESSRSRYYPIELASEVPIIRYRCVYEWLHEVQGISQ